MADGQNTEQIIIEMTTPMVKSAFREVSIPDGFRDQVRQILGDSSPMFIHVKVAESGAHSRNKRIYEMDSVMKIRDAIMNKIEGAAGHPVDNRTGGYQETVMRWLNAELDENTGELYAVGYIYPNAQAIRASCATAKASNGKIATSILGKGRVTDEGYVRDLEVERIDIVEPTLAGIPSMAVVPLVTESIELVEALSGSDVKRDMDVQWNSSGGTAYGRIERIVTNGQLNVPDSSFTLNASEENPALLIRVYRKVNGGFLRTETLVGHRANSVNRHEKFNVLEEEPSEEEAYKSKQHTKDMSEPSKGKGYKKMSETENTEKTQDIVEMERRVLELGKINEAYQTLKRRVDTVMEMLNIADTADLSTNIQGLQIENTALREENARLLESAVDSIVANSLPSEAPDEIHGVLVESVWKHEPTTRSEVESAWNAVRESVFGKRMIKIAMANLAGPPVVSENKTLDDRQQETDSIHESDEETDSFVFGI